MDRLIGWHLRLARHAGPGTLDARTPVGPVIDDILLVLRWPLADRNMQADVDRPEDAGFTEGRQDLEEMIGNPAENAVKWGQSRLRINVRPLPGRLILRIKDDGPRRCRRAPWPWPGPHGWTRTAPRCGTGPCHHCGYGGAARRGTAENSGWISRMWVRLATVLDLPA